MRRRSERLAAGFGGMIPGGKEGLEEASAMSGGSDILKPEMEKENR